jgi:hypothetical protein
VTALLVLTAVLCAVAGWRVWATSDELSDIRGWRLTAAVWGGLVLGGAAAITLALVWAILAG